MLPILTAGVFLAIQRPSFVPHPELPAATLATLAVIAYRQPVGYGDREIPGLAAAYCPLQERGLSDSSAARAPVGRPLRTRLFLELLGARSRRSPQARSSHLTAAASCHTEGPMTRG